MVHAVWPWKTPRSGWDPGWKPDRAIQLFKRFQRHQKDEAEVFKDDIQVHWGDVAGSHSGSEDVHSEED